MGRLRLADNEGEDLLIEAAKRQRRGLAFGGVIFAPQRALSVGEFIEELELLVKAGGPVGFANPVHCLPRR